MIKQSRTMRILFYIFACFLGTSIAFNPELLDPFPLNFTLNEGAGRDVLMVDDDECHNLGTSTKPASPSAAAPCKPKWQNFAATKSCYKAIDKMPWEAANLACQADGGFLTSIHSLAEGDFVTDVVTSAFPNGSCGIGGIVTKHRYRFFIGLDLSNHARPRWVDGTPLNYTQFWDGEPNNAFGTEFCGSMHFRCGEEKVSNWNDIHCTDVVPSVCKYTLKDEATEMSELSIEMANVCLEVFDRPDCSSEAERRLFKSGCTQADCCNYPDSSDLCGVFQGKARSYRACKVLPEIPDTSNESYFILLWYMTPVFVVIGGSILIVICCFIFANLSRKKGKNVQGYCYVSDVEGAPVPFSRY